MIDFNCYVGNWPFNKLRKKTLADLRELHKKHGITSGYVSSIESIFFNDFYESEKDLYEELKGSGYSQVTVVNPTLAFCPLALERCIKEFDIKGIRLSPGYHGYHIDSEIVDPVMKIAREYNLPVFVSLRMMDERLTHIIHPEIPTIDEISAFLKKYPDNVIILTHIKVNESPKLEEFADENTKVFFDMSGFRSNIVKVEHYNKILRKSVFGSAFPLISIASTAELVKNEVDDEEAKDAILNNTKIKKYL